MTIRPALLAAFALACGGPPEKHIASFALDQGATVRVESTAPWAGSPSLRGDIATIVAASLRYWRGMNLDGWTIEITDGPVDCPFAHEGQANGCSIGAERRILVSTMAYVDTGSGEPIQAKCPEQTVLIHEIGHAIISDIRHTDPRWTDWAIPWLDLQSPAFGNGCSALDVRVWAN